MGYIAKKIICILSSFVGLIQLDLDTSPVSWQHASPQRQTNDGRKETISNSRNDQWIGNNIQQNPANDVFEHMISQGLQVKSLGAVRRASLHQALSESLRTAAEPLCGEYPGRIQSPGSAFCQVFFF